MPRYVDKPSPNQSERIHGQQAVRLIVAHTPEGSYAGALATVTNPLNKVSYHELVNEDGREVSVLVPWSRKAWHAGAVNSLSEGISAAGWARNFDAHSAQAVTFAGEIARRLVARGLRPQWTTDPVKGGFCRHGDLQADRSDPTPDLAEWRVFVGMVQAEHQRLTSRDKPWPVPLPVWTWGWMAWKLKGSPRGQRPASAPRLIPLWAWRRLKALKEARQ